MYAQLHTAQLKFEKIMAKFSCFFSRKFAKYGWDLHLNSKSTPGSDLGRPKPPIAGSPSPFGGLIYAKEFTMFNELLCF